ncbi:myotrophin isoform X1 [Mobula hypostoma]|uniref:myotrophin isoform X1 n=1 Tax=Mobula hypostoma TaxID=723540 RepID=UPI002FC31BED
MSQIDTDVIWSVRNGELEEVKNFVAKGADVNKIVVAGRKPIHFAADSGQLDVLEFLIHAGADINTPDANGFTALMSAVCEGHLDCVRLLLSKAFLLCCCSISLLTPGCNCRKQVLMSNQSHEHQVKPYIVPV